jgi:hypothetical protein
MGVNVWSVVVCQYAGSVKEKTGILDAQAMAWYNFTGQCKGAIYGRETKDVYAVRYA